MDIPLQPPPSPLFLSAKENGFDRLPPTLGLNSTTSYRRWLLRAFGWRVVPVPFSDHAQHLLSRGKSHQQKYLVARFAAAGLRLKLGQGVKEEGEREGAVVAPSVQLE